MLAIRLRLSKKVILNVIKKKRFVHASSIRLQSRSLLSIQLIFFSYLDVFFTDNDTARIQLIAWYYQSFFGQSVRFCSTHRILSIAGACHEYSNVNNIALQDQIVNVFAK